MSGSLHLVISTPEQRLVDAEGVTAVRARDESGSFGVLPRHADLLTVLPASVVRWREADGEARFCAVRAGVLSVSEGRTVAIACREALLGDRLDELERGIAARRAAETDADRRARVAQMQLHARAVRQIMRFLMPAAHDGLDSLFAEHGQ